MKQKVKIINIHTLPNDPLITAEIYDIDCRKILRFDALDRILQYIEKHKEFECINLGYDRLGLPCVLDI